MKRSGEAGKVKREICGLGMWVYSYLRTSFILIWAKFQWKLKNTYFREFSDERFRRKPVVYGKRRLHPLGGRADHRPAAQGLFSGGRVVALGEVRVFETLDLAKAGTYEWCWRQATERLDRSSAQSRLGIFWWNSFVRTRTFCGDIPPFRFPSPGTRIPVLTWEVWSEGGHDDPLTNTPMANTLTPASPSEYLFWDKGYYTSALPFSSPRQEGRAQP